MVVNVGVYGVVFGVVKYGLFDLEVIYFLVIIVK